MMLSRLLSRGLVRAVLPMLAICLAVSVSPAQTLAPGGAAPTAAPVVPAPPAPPPAFPALPGILADYRGLHAGASYAASGKELHVGHLRMLFNSGTLTALQTATGREAGFVFNGTGRYDYTTED